MKEFKWCSSYQILWMEITDHTHQIPIDKFVGNGTRGNEFKIKQSQKSRAGCRDT